MKQTLSRRRFLAASAAAALCGCASDPKTDDKTLGKGVHVAIIGAVTVLYMRLPDPHGAWKCHPDDPRLMVAREPTEEGGTYYRILPEGFVRDYDGFMLKVNRDLEGLDLAGLVRVAVAEGIIESEDEVADHLRRSIARKRAPT